MTNAMRYSQLRRPTQTPVEGLRPAATAHSAAVRIMTSSVPSHSRHAEAGLEAPQSRADELTRP